MQKKIDQTQRMRHITTTSFCLVLHETAMKILAALCSLQTSTSKHRLQGLITCNVPASTHSQPEPSDEHYLKIVDKQSADAMSNEKRVQEACLKAALAAANKVSEAAIEGLQWVESKGAAVDDGFTTELVAVKGRAKINGQLGEFSLMVKMTPEVGYRQKMVKEMGIFDKEYLLYGVILPLLCEARQDKELEPLKVPECYFAQSDPGLLVMNNLKDKGFDLLKNQANGLSRGLQGNELTLFLTSLASFHATTYHLMTRLGGKLSLLQKYPELENVRPMGADMKSMFQKMQSDIVASSAAIAKAYIDEDASRKMAAYQPRLWPEFHRGMFQPYGQFQTIIHGDAWANNCMYIYHNGEAKEIALLDFQCSRVTSPAIDVSYAIYTGTRPDLRAQFLEDWLKLYHDQFSRDLVAFGYDPQQVYDYQEFRQDFRDLFGYGFQWALQHSQGLLAQDDLEKMKNCTTEEMAEMSDDMVQMQVKQAETNLTFRERIVGLVQEAINNEYL